MKTFFTVLVITFISSGAFAQLDKGTMMVGGSFGLEISTNKSKNNSTTMTNSKTSGISVAPQFGYFVINNLVVGGGLEVGTSVTKDDNDDEKNTSTSIELEPFVRYYLPQKIFFQGKFGVGSATNKYENNGETTKYKYNTSGWAISAGYAAFLNDNVAIEPQLGYGSEGRKNKDTDIRYFDQGLFIRVGFQIYLRK